MSVRAVSSALAASVLVLSGCAAEDVGATSTSDTAEAHPARIASTATQRESTPPSTTLAEPPMLRENGIGPVDIGDPESAAMVGLVEAFGTPTSDITHAGPFGEDLRCSTALGIPCFDYVRIVEWDAHGLTIVISDWIPSSETRSFEKLEAPPNLRGFEYTGGSSGPALQTAEGITIGSTLEDLRRAFGNDLHMSADPCTFDTEYGFTLQPRPTIVAGLWGQLSRHPEDGIVESLGAGVSSGC